MQLGCVVAVNASPHLQGIPDIRATLQGQGLPRRRCPYQVRSHFCGFPAGRFTAVTMTERRL